MAYRASNNNGSICTPIWEIIRYLHARISTANNKDIFAIHVPSIEVLTAMHVFSFEPFEPFNPGHIPFTILPRRNDQKLRDINLISIWCYVPDNKPPFATVMIKMCRFDIPVIPDGNLETRDIAVQVTEKVNPWNKGGEIRGEGHVREAAEIFAQVKFQSVICSFPPKRCMAIISFKDKIGDWKFVETCRGCKTSRACTHNHNRNFNLHDTDNGFGFGLKLVCVGFHLLLCFCFYKLVQFMTLFIWALLMSCHLANHECHQPSFSFPFLLSFYILVNRVNRKIQEKQYN